MYIDGTCRTNLDAFEREEWPDRFVAVPRKGERVASRSGKSLVVGAVTHCIGAGDKPFIRVELHL